MKVTYEEIDGKIHFHCEEGDHEASGTIPKSIENRGRKEIKAYAIRQAKTSIKKKTNRRKKIDEFCANPDFPVSTRYDRKQLKGKIFLVDDDHCLHVRLEKPYKGEAAVRFGWASAMAGRQILEEKGVAFTAAAIEAAEKLLVSIYKDKKHERTHRKTIKIVDELNKDSR